ncbi:MAG: hypothetical protein ABI113_20610 [Mucilaginibacter sp.]
MVRLKIPDIAAMPSATLTGRDFDFVNICWIRTWDGQEVEILFDENGYPLLDQALIQRIGNYFNKKFQPIQIDREQAFANILNY